jgi:hypothetical protein
MFHQKKVESHFPVTHSISAKVNNLLHSKFYDCFKILLLETKASNAPVLHDGVVDIMLGPGHAQTSALAVSHWQAKHAKLGFFLLARPRPRHGQQRPQQK